MRGAGLRWFTRTLRGRIPTRLSDDEKLYKPTEFREGEAQRDPLPKFGLFLVREGVLDEAEVEHLEAEVDREILETTRSSAGSGAAIARFDLSFRFIPHEVDPTEAAFETEPQFIGASKTMVEMVSATLADEMARDERVLLFGEDVADCSIPDHVDKVKGKGGVFKATAGLQRRFGSERVFNTPLAEAAIIGRAIGLGTRGLKPVPEIQFFDYIWPAMMQMRSEMATLRWRSAGGFKCPMVIRSAIGGYLDGRRDLS